MTYKEIAKQVREVIENESPGEINWEGLSRTINNFGKAAAQSLEESILAAMGRPEQIPIVTHPSLFGNEAYFISASMNTAGSSSQQQSIKPRVIPKGEYIYCHQCSAVYATMNFEVLEGQIIQAHHIDLTIGNAVNGMKMECPLCHADQGQSFKNALRPVPYATAQATNVNLVPNQGPIQPRKGYQLNNADLDAISLNGNGRFPFIIKYSATGEQFEVTDIDFTGNCNTYLLRSSNGYSVTTYGTSTGYEFVRTGGFLSSVAFDEPAFKTHVHGVFVDPKCECGSEAVGSPGHSSWCPKFTG